VAVPLPLPRPLPLPLPLPKGCRELRPAEREARAERRELMLVGVVQEATLRRGRLQLQLGLWPSALLDIEAITLPLALALALPLPLPLPLPLALPLPLPLPLALALPLPLPVTLP
jgi:hypothetical protein